MKYRIVKKHWRSRRTAEIKNYFIIEVGEFQIMLWMRKFRWKPYKIANCYGYGMGYYEEIKEFETKKEAKEYLKNLRKSIPQDEYLK